MCVCIQYIFMNVKDFLRSNDQEISLIRVHGIQICPVLFLGYGRIWEE